ncbi:MAG: type II secretion system minor pseudopilin GspJ [Spongiibacteraceae bacterium]|nr:type II secretion system minor pseudopilin GspJ [Spongiibacteraceae bacterium]
MNRRSNSRGFTLVETLVALAIFALLGAAAWQVLSSVMTAEERLSERALELRRLNRTFAQLQSDIEMMVRRPVRVGDSSEAWLLVDPEARQPLRFTRGGRLNPLELPRSSLQRVAYSLGPHPDREVADSTWFGDERTHLLRHVWPVVDRTGMETALVQVLLEDVEALSFAVQGPKGLSERWPLPAAPGDASRQDRAESLADAPRAIIVQLQHPRFGELRRLFRVF